MGFMGGENSSVKNPIYHSVPGLFLLNLFYARNSPSSPEFGARWGQQVAVPVTSRLCSAGASPKLHSTGCSLPPSSPKGLRCTWAIYLLGWAVIQKSALLWGAAWELIKRQGETPAIITLANKGQLMWHGMQNRGSPGFQELRLWNRGREENASQCQE